MPPEAIFYVDFGVSETLYNPKIIFPITFSFNPRNSSHLLYASIIAAL